jgi:hypothetical protein
MSIYPGNYNTQDTIDIAVTIEHETDMALLVYDGDTKTWVPKSQIQYDEDAQVGDTIDIEMPEWLAMDKGFI